MTTAGLILAMRSVRKMKSTYTARGNTGAQLRIDLAVRLTSKCSSRDTPLPLGNKELWQILFGDGGNVIWIFRTNFRGWKCSRVLDWMNLVVVVCLRL